MPSISSLSKIFIDSMIFIYLFEADSRYIKKVKKLFFQIEGGKIEAVTSIITPLEVLSAPKLEDEQEKKTAISRFFQKTPNLSVSPLTWEIMERAANLRRTKPTLKTPDSIQLATALETKSPIFITNDAKLKKIKLENLKILSINEFDRKSNN